MRKESAPQENFLKGLQSELKTLQSELIDANKIAGLDEYINVKVKKNQARFMRIKRMDEDDKAVGKFLIQIDITSKQDTVFVPISIASGKKQTGFIYQIEGTGEGSISTANVACKGEGVSQVTLGTLIYSKIPKGKTASFRIRATINGKFAKTYKVVINRINYKHAISDARYTQYNKEIVGDSVTFS